MYAAAGSSERTCLLSGPANKRKRIGGGECTLKGRKEESVRHGTEGGSGWRKWHGKVGAWLETRRTVSGLA